jgi:glycosyltransferase involved in cell wall biosynthesis
LPADRAQSEVGEHVKPRVVILVTLAEVGGAQTYVALLAEALRDRFDVVVASWGPGPLIAAVRRAGARFIPLRHVQRELHPVRDVLGLVELVRLLRRERPQIMHANSSKAGILGRIAAAIAGVPVRIFTVHGWAYHAHTGTAAKIYLWAERLVAPLTTLTICVADRDRTSGIAARTCRADRTVVQHNAVPLPPTAERARRTPPVVLSIGRLKAPKDFSTLLQALAQLEPGSFRARIVGDGPERERLEEETQNLGLTGSLEFLGERDDVAALIDDADVFVLASHAEGLPMSMLEAMAASLPVVASAVGGVPELVDDESGVLVPPANPGALAAAIRDVLADPERRLRLGRGARARIEERFDLESWGLAHLNFYTRELERAGAPVDRAP